MRRDMPPTRHVAALLCLLGSLLALMAILVFGIGPGSTPSRLVERAGTSTEIKPMEPKPGLWTDEAHEGSYRTAVEGDPLIHEGVATQPAAAEIAGIPRETLDRVLGSLHSETMPQQGAVLEQVRTRYQTLSWPSPPTVEGDSGDQTLRDIGCPMSEQTIGIVRNDTVRKLERE